MDTNRHESEHMDGSHEFAWVDANSFRENPFNPFLHCSYYNDETLLAGGKNLECGDLSPLCCFGDLSPKQGRVQRPGRVGRLPAFDGDKSPAESADKSAHSKGFTASSRRVVLCSFVVVLCSFACSAATEPWPLFRGPRGAGC